MRKFNLLRFSIFEFVCFLSLALWASAGLAQKGGASYQYLMQAEQAESLIPQISIEIRKLGGEKAGTEELGTKVKKNFIFNFLIPDTNQEKLAEYLRGIAPIKILKRSGNEAPQGKVKIILSLIPKAGVAKANLPKDNIAPEDYPHPMMFGLKENGVKVSEFQWTFDVGDKVTFKFLGVALQHSDFDLKVAPGKGYTFTWPKFFIERPVIEIRNEKDDILYRKEITADDKVQETRGGRSVAQVPVVAPSPMPSEAPQVTVSPGAQAEIPNPSVSPAPEAALAPPETELVQVPSIIMKYQTKEPEDLPEDLKKNKAFRVCFFFEKYKEKIEYCTRRMAWNPKGKANSIAPLKFTKESQVVANGKKFKKAAGQLLFKEERRHQELRLTFKNGAKMVAIGQKPGSEVLEAYVDSEKQSLFSGRGLRPDLAKDAPPGTPSDAEWLAKANKGKNNLIFRNKAFVPFLQTLEVSKDLPFESDRPFLAKRSMLSTYTSDTDLKIYVPGDGVSISGKKSDVQQVGSNTFDWNYKMGQRGVDHRNNLNVTTADGRTFSAFREIHQGFPMEFSARMTGVLSNTASILFLGEFAGSVWLESLFGWKNYWLSTNRWGAGGNYFQSLTTSQLDLKALHSNLRYRFTPGVWNRDETVGATLGFTSVTYRTSQANLLGLGMLWARTMPRIFDDLLNLVPFFRYPKWVDMEGIFYFLPLESNIKTNGTFSLTFHGKMFLRPEFFIEAGFGIKRYSYSDSIARRDATTNMLFGTGGVGYNF